MKITIFSFVATVIYSSSIILLLYFLRTKARLVSVCSTSNIVLLYMFCAIRLSLPLEFAWTLPVPMPVIINPIYAVLKRKISLGEAGSIKLYWILAAVALLVALIKISVLIKDYLKIYSTITKFSKKRILKDNGNRDLGKENIEIRECEIIGSPFSFGIFKKMILLPAKEYETETEKLILMHEYMHHANRDLPVKMLTEIFVAIFWWNPIVYLLGKDLNQTFELRCDQKVVEKLDFQGRIKYLQVLLEEYKNADERALACGLGFSNSVTTFIEERFKEIKNFNAGKKKYGNCLVPIFFVVTFFLSYTVVFQSQYKAPDGQMNTHYGEEVSREKNYIYEYEKKYYISINNDLIEIDDDCLQDLLNDGFELKEGL